jgi:hypothetical protein
MASDHSILRSYQKLLAEQVADGRLDAATQEVRVLRKYSSAGQDNDLHSLSSENGPGLLPAASHYRGTRAQGPLCDFGQTRPSTRVTNADLT